MKALAPPLLLLSSCLSLSNPAPTTPAKYGAAKDDIFKRGDCPHHSPVTVTEDTFLGWPTHFFRSWSALDTAMKSPTELIREWCSLCKIATRSRWEEEEMPPWPSIRADCKIGTNVIGSNIGHWWSKDTITGSDWCWPLWHRRRFWQMWCRPLLIAIRRRHHERATERMCELIGWLSNNVIICRYICY